MAASVFDEPADERYEALSAFKRGLLRQAVEAVTAGSQNTGLASVFRPNLKNPQSFEATAKAALAAPPLSEQIGDRVLGKEKELIPGSPAEAAREFGKSSADAAAMLTGLLATRPAPPKGQVNMFIGPNAVTYDKERAARIAGWIEAAKRRLPDIMPDELNSYTMRSMDMRGMHEPVSDTILLYEPTRTADTIPDLVKRMHRFEKANGRGMTLGELMHPDDVAHYPGLGNVSVNLGMNSFFAHKGTRPYISLSGFTDNPTSVLKHEATHAALSQERVPLGGSPEWIRKWRQYMENVDAAVPARERDMEHKALNAVFRQGPYDPEPPSDMLLYQRLLGERLARASEGHGPSLRPQDVLPVKIEDAIIDQGTRATQQSLGPPVSSQPMRADWMLRHGVRYLHPEEPPAFPAPPRPPKLP